MCTKKNYVNLNVHTKDGVNLNVHTTPGYFKKNFQSTCRKRNINICVPLHQSHAIELVLQFAETEFSVCKTTTTPRYKVFLKLFYNFGTVSTKLYAYSNCDLPSTTLYCLINVCFENFVPKCYTTRFHSSKKPKRESSPNQEPNILYEYCPYLVQLLRGSQI